MPVYTLICTNTNCKNKIDKFFNNYNESIKKVEQGEIRCPICEWPMERTVQKSAYTPGKWVTSPL